MVGKGLYEANHRGGVPAVACWVGGVCPGESAQLGVHFLHYRACVCSAHFPGISTLNVHSVHCLIRVYPKSAP